MELAANLGRRGVLAGAAALAGCGQPGALAEDTAPRLGPDRTGYIAVQAPIFPALRDAFITDANRLLALGAAELYVLIASPGGIVSVAQEIIGFMDRTRSERGTRFATHNTGLVASAACYVFLAGQHRVSVPQGKFLFHEASLVSTGPITSQDLQEESAKMQQTERSFVAMLTARTKLTAAEAVTFIRSTVVLSAEQAQRDGITNATEEFKLPTGATISQLRAVPGRAVPARSGPGG